MDHNLNCLKNLDLVENVLLTNDNHLENSTLFEKVCSFLAVASAAPQFAAISEVVNSRTGGTFGISLDCESKFL